MPSKFHEAKVAEILSARPGAKGSGMAATIRKHLSSKTESAEEAGLPVEQWAERWFDSGAHPGRKISLPRPDAHELVMLGGVANLVCYEVVNSAAINCGRMAWYSSLCDRFYDIRFHLFVYDCRSDASFLMNDQLLEEQQFYLDDASYHKGFQLAPVVGDWCVTGTGLALSLVNTYNLAVYEKDLEDA